MAQVNLGFAVISIFLGILVSIPYAMIPQKKVFPGNALLGVFISLIISSFNPVLRAMIGGSVDSNSIVCVNDYTVADISQASCAITAIISYTPGMFGICLWACIAVSVIIKVMHVKISRRMQTIVSFTFSGSFSLLGTIIFMSKKAVAGSPLFGTCGIDPNAYQGWYFAALFNIPVGIMLIMGTFSILFTLGYISYISYDHGTNCLPVLAFLKSQWRIVTFIGNYWYAAVVAIGYWIYTRIHQDDFAASVGNYYGCLYLTWGELVKNGTAPAVADTLTLEACSEPFFPTFSPFLAVTVCAHVSIIIFSLVFLMDKHIYNWYHHVITTRKLPEPDQDSFATDASIQSSIVGSSESRM